MAGNDIGIGPGLAAGCSPVPKVVSEIAEAIESVCCRVHGGRGEEKPGEADLKRYAQRISGPGLSQST